MQGRWKHWSQLLARNSVSNIVSQVEEMRRIFAMQIRVHTWSLRALSLSLLSPHPASNRFLQLYIDIYTDTHTLAHQLYATLLRQNFKKKEKENVLLQGSSSSQSSTRPNLVNNNAFSSISCLVWFFEVDL